MIKFDVTVNSIDDNLFYVCGWDTEDEIYVNDDLDIISNFSSVYRNYLELALEKNAIVKNDGIYFQNKIDAEATAMELIIMLGDRYQILEGIVYESIA
ncbi:hypothetical protein ACDN41_12505 [Priestia aryabhattai]|uniref:hypothetical protein n=1 Tax=Priestia aryabhattai TaxID=412384 RepID=UPI0035318060